MELPDDKYSAGYGIECITLYNILTRQKKRHPAVWYGFSPVHGWGWDYREMGATACIYLGVAEQVSEDFLLA